MKILIVDDERSAYIFLEKIFKNSFSEEEIEIDYVYNFKSAEQQILHHKYDVITLDGILSDKILDPWQHGFGKYLIPVIKKYSSMTTIIALSGDKVMNREAMAMGATIAYTKNEVFGPFLFNKDFSLRKMPKK